MNKIKNILYLGILCLLVTTGCTNNTSDNSATYKSYIKAVMDASYKGELDDYMEFTDSTEDEASEVYDYEMQYFAETIMYYNGVEYDSISEETYNKYVELAKEVYAKTEYTVNEAEKTSSTYYVKIEINPVDFLDITYDAVEEYINTYNQKYEGVTESTTEMEEEYALGILDVITPYVSQTGNKETVSKIVEIIFEDDSYGIDNDDWYDIDDIVAAID